LPADFVLKKCFSNKKRRIRFYVPVYYTLALLDLASKISREVLFGLFFALQEKIWYTFSIAIRMDTQE
jgi:hypothetical protein